jgi:hypothetical protein
MKKTTKQSTAISIQKSYAIDKPAEMAKMAVILRNHIIKNKLYTSIMGKNYINVEGWSFAGGLLGVFPQVKEVTQLAPGKWMAKVELINQKTKEVVGTGFALCSKEEMKKKSFDEYAILSMAQTRAIGKAYRNLIGWVMKIAGYETAPAEEMVKGGKVEETTQQQVQEEISEMGNNPKIEELKGMLKGETDEEKIADLKKKTGIVLKDFNITAKHAGVIIATILNMTTLNNK